jgi:septal ring-binding cell division protein DamX
VQKLTHLIFIIIFISCGTEPEFQEVMINKTVKVFSQDYHNDSENYTFKWEPPVGPSKVVVPFDLKNDMLIFSPKVEGDYQIHLSIADISDEVIAEEMFYYRAIAETIEVAIAKPIPEEDLTKQISTVNEPKKKTRAKTNINQQSKTRKKQNKKSTNIDNVHYTIQVAAWPSLEHARLDQLKLIEEGMDAYIQRHYRNEDDQVWYRVRIGNFKSKEKASIVQKQIESITHTETWLDILLSGQK